MRKARGTKIMVEDVDIKEYEDVDMHQIIPIQQSHHIIQHNHSQRVINLLKMKHHPNQKRKLYNEDCLITQPNTGKPAAHEVPAPDANELPATAEQLPAYLGIEHQSNDDHVNVNDEVNYHQLYDEHQYYDEYGYNNEYNNEELNEEIYYNEYNNNLLYIDEELDALSELNAPTTKPRSKGATLGKTPTLLMIRSVPASSILTISPVEDFAISDDKENQPANAPSIQSLQAIINVRPRHALASPVKRVDPAKIIALQNITNKILTIKDYQSLRLLQGIIPIPRN